MAYNLSLDQQRLVNMYINHYNQTNSQIDNLHDMVDEIRNNILNILSANQTSRHRTNRRSNQNLNNIATNTNINSFISNLSNQNQSNYVSYDYNAPLNPNLYSSQSFSSPFTTHGLFNATSPTPTIPTPTNRNSNVRNLFNWYTDLFNSNVVVSPTPQEIRNAAAIVRYRDIQNPLSETCPITLERFNPDDIVRQIHFCGHIFSQSAFIEWFHRNVRCPVCRYDIRTYVNNAATTNANINTATNNDDDNSSTDDNLDQENNNLNAPNLNAPNLNAVRSPESNQVDHITFDLPGGQATTDFINIITDRIVQGMLNPNANNDDRFMFDASNNFLLYETILRPNNGTR